jgi:hypothetical protein
MQNFPEDQPKGLFANPITIKDDDNEEVLVLQRSEEVLVLQWSEEVLVLQRSEEAREELLLRFATY